MLNIILAAVIIAAAIGFVLLLILCLYALPEALMRLGFSEKELTIWDTRYPT